MQFTNDEVMMAVNQLSAAARLELERNLWRNRAEGVLHAVPDEESVGSETSEESEVDL